MASPSESDSFVEQDSEDDFDWEEVEVPEHQEQEQHLEITIPALGPRSKKAATASKYKGIPHAERLKRIDCHKARLLSLTPLALQTAFGMIHKSRVPDQIQRGRMFEAAISNLVEWWTSTYFEVVPIGHIKNRTYDDIQTKLAKLGPPPTDSDAILDIEDVEDLLGDEPEVIRSPKSLMKHALMANGSRDISAQLFTALCRGLGIPARLVVSLQSVPWQTNVGKPKPTYTRKPKGDKGKGKAKESENGAEKDGEEFDTSTPTSFSRSGSEAPSRGSVFFGEGQRLDGTPVPKSDKAKGKAKAKPVINLRKTKIVPDPRTTPPVFWTEVFSRPDGRWIPVDPIRSIVNKRKVFDPTPTASTPATVHSPLFPQAYAASIDRRAIVNNASRLVRQENRMVYVLAFEEDGYARDVTRRYAKEFSAKIAKVQGGSSTIGGGGSARLAWWEGVMSTVSRPYRLHRDDVEDEELDMAQLTEGMPTTVSGFKDHPIYALSRHLKQNQVIHPPDTLELGKFRGEAVYPRSAVVSLKTAENWMRSEGRMVSEGSQPLKMVKVRAGTINRMRELEVRKDELKEAGDPGGNVGETMQGLYGRNQTEPYRPDPVVDGKVPKNNFGNIDLYVPSMLPRGAAHVPYKGVAKIARKLNFDFAEAVTGFEFKKRRAFPVLEGVVVAQENEAALLEAYWEAEQDAEKKARIKREERVLKQWTRLVQGLRIRQRLQAQYATKPDAEAHSHEDGTYMESEPGTSKDIIITMSHPGVGAGGGFLVGADDVVQPFHLPKFKYRPSGDVGISDPKDEAKFPDPVNAEEPTDKFPLTPNDGTYDLVTMEEDLDVEMDLEEVSTSKPQLSLNGRGPAPKSMRELAEDAAYQHDIAPQDDDEYMDTDALRPLSGDRGPDEHGAAQTKLTPRSLRVTLKLSSNAATSSGASTPTAKTRGVPRRASARLSKKAKSKKRARDDDTGDDTGEEMAAPTPKKRATKAAETTPAPTRTLRPRSSRSTAQVKEAEKREEAYRRAIER
ncbi:hypothetical protein DXG01_008058 [Tephrocybe rancida]|nr:hypothetical protein DXG01_008058 [Tephrocybe rancida]